MKRSRPNLFLLSNWNVGSDKIKVFEDTLPFGVIYDLSYVVFFQS